MAGPRKSTWWLLGGLAFLLVAVLVSVGVIVVRATLGEQKSDEVAAPAFPVPGLRTKPQPVLAPVGSRGAAATPAGVKKALTTPLADPRLGTNVSATVLDAATGEALFSQQADMTATPASSTKLATAAAALTALGPDHRFTTKAVAGKEPGSVVLVGGGDPTLAAGEKTEYPLAARLDLLAAQVKKALGGTQATRVYVDSSRFTGPNRAQGWDPDVVGGFISPIAALVTDGGRTKPGVERWGTTPAATAGQQFAEALGAEASYVSEAPAPADAKRLGAVKSPVLSSIVETMLQRSDNEIAEMLAHETSIARQGPGSFAGGAAATAAILSGLGLPAAEIKLSDASGLSRNNKLSPRVLARVVTLAAGGSKPELRSILTGLPVAGFSGTLDDRFGGGSATDARGVLRAKTGTLAGVSSLSGMVVDSSGRQLVFAFLADKVPTGGTPAAETALDALGGTLAKCGC